MYTTLFRRSGWLVAAILVGTLPAHALETFQWDDLFKVERVAGATISPLGAHVAVVTERAAPESYWARTSALWLVSTRDGQMRRVFSEAGEREQRQPVWSPDGERLAFVAVTSQGAKLRLVRTVDPSSASTVAACEEKEGVAAVAWAPDGTRLAVLCDRALERPTKVPAVIVASESEHFGGRPLAPMSERRLVLFDLAAGSGREIAKSTTFLAGNGNLLWRTDRTIWIVSTPPGDFAGLEFLDSRVLHRVDVETGTLTTLPRPWRGARSLLHSPDGAEFIAMIDGTIGAMQWKQTWRLLPLQLQVIDHEGARLSTSDPLEVILPRGSPAAWVPGAGPKADSVLYFTWLDRGSGRVKAYEPRSRRWRNLTPADLNVDSFSVTADGRTMALVQGDANTPADVYLLDLTRRNARAVRLTQFGSAVHRLYTVSPIERLKWRSADDRFDIDGWLVKPAGYRKGERYPLIVDVHGGPGVAFRNRFEDLHLEGAHQVPPELYAAKGYLVLMVNPRGDPGYGREYQEALLEGWEYPTRHDILSGVDHVIRLGYADPERLGIGGASYGGWVTTFAVTQTDRFKAASANDPVIDSNISSAAAYRGARASNFWLHSGFAGGLPGDAPFPSVDPRRVKTPILLRFGLKEQPPFPSQFFVSGLPYFTYLHSHCRPVEMIMHPEEGHGIGNGETWRDYVQRDLRWFDYWLKGEGTNPVGLRSCDADDAATRSVATAKDP